MKDMGEDLELHAVFEVEDAGYLIGRDLWSIKFRTYGGSMMEFTLYTNGGEPCPFNRGDFYSSEEGDHGGWRLVRLPQSEIDSLKAGKAAYEALSPAEKARRTRDFHKKFTLTEDYKRRALRRRPTAHEEQCDSLMPEWTPGSKRWQCGFVWGHSGSHWSGVGAGQGYQWDDEEEDDGVREAEATT